MPVTINDLTGRKVSGPPIVMLTAYDYPTALALDEAQVDVILVGDSVGTNILGYDNEQSVTVQDMEHHTRAVRRGAKRAFVLVDLPYASYESAGQGLETARRLRDAGADGVKLEGCLPEVVSAIHNAGIPVCSHLGLKPQTQPAARVQGRTYSAARQLVEESLIVEAAGADMLLLELVPREVAAAATERLHIPTIGIGSGPHTTGQVLVVNDLVGITQRSIRHSARYAEFGVELRDAVAQYRNAVSSRAFPGDSNSVAMDPAELTQLRAWIVEFST